MAEELNVEWLEESGYYFLDKEEILQWNRRIPQFSGNKKAEKRLQLYYNRVSEVWEQRWRTIIYWRATADFIEKRENSKVFHPWKVVLSIESAETQTDYLTIGISAEEKQCRALAHVTFQSQIWNKSLGVPVLWSEVEKSLPWKKIELINELQQEARKREDILWREGYEEGIRKNFSKNRIFFS